MLSNGEEVAVVGSGASGLAAAFRLKEAGYRVTVLESGGSPGGKMRTTRRDGYLIEEGPSIMSQNYLSIIGVARDAGLGDELVEAGGIFGFPRDGEVHYFDPASLLRDGFASTLLSPAAKLRLPRVFLDCLRHRDALTRGDLASLFAHDTESAAVYGRKIFGQELLDYVCSATIRALAGCSPQDLSKLDLLYCFNNFLGTPKFYAFREGMAGYAHAMAHQLDIQYGANVLAADQRGDSVQLTWQPGTGPEQTREFAGCVLATSAHVTARIHGQLDSWSQDFLTRVRYSPNVNASVGLSTVPDNAAAFILMPEIECPELLGMALEHNKVASRAPAGKGLLGIYGSSEYSADLLERDDDTCADRLLAAAETILPGCSDDAEFVQIARWDAAVMKAPPGYWSDLRRFSQRYASRSSRIRLAGDYFCTSNINSATSAGERAARALTIAMNRPAHTTTVPRQRRTAGLRDRHVATAPVGRATALRT